MNPRINFIFRQLVSEIKSTSEDQIHYVDLLEWVKNETDRFINDTEIDPRSVKFSPLPTYD